jgi:hypothetical protein
MDTPLGSARYPSSRMIVPSLSKKTALLIFTPLQLADGSNERSDPRQPLRETKPRNHHPTTTNNETLNRFEMRRGMERARRTIDSSNGRRQPINNREVRGVFSSRTSTCFQRFKLFFDDFEWTPATAFIFAATLS